MDVKEKNNQLALQNKEKSIFILKHYNYDIEMLRPCQYLLSEYNEIELLNLLKCKVLDLRHGKGGLIDFIDPEASIDEMIYRLLCHQSLCLTEIINEIALSHDVINTYSRNKYIKIIKL